MQRAINIFFTIFSLIRQFILVKQVSECIYIIILIQPINPGKKFPALPEELRRNLHYLLHCLSVFLLVKCCPYLLKYALCQRHSIYSNKVVRLLFYEVWNINSWVRYSHPIARELLIAFVALFRYSILVKQIWNCMKEYSNWR